MSAEPAPVPWFVDDVLAATALAIAVLVWLTTSSPGLLIRTITTMFCTLFWLAFATAVAACCVAASIADWSGAAGAC